MNKFLAVLVLCFSLCSVSYAGWFDSEADTSDSGIKKASVRVPVGTDGLTTEQRNVVNRLRMDNLPGSIKHLYIISAYSGQVLIYSTVKGKVTSSGKRLNPMTVAVDGHEVDADGFNVQIAGHNYKTTEVEQDDGTFGSSVDYIYWWDVRGVYHQQYITGGMIVHISDQPIAVKSVVINMEEANVPADK